MLEFLTFVSADWIVPLCKELIRITDEREKELIRIADQFGDPKLLAKYYIEPYCQHLNPAEFNEEEPVSDVRSQVFSTLNEFLKGEFKSLDLGGRNQLFVLSDAGMGKTSLLIMIRLMHLMAFWPPGYECVLMRIGPETLDEVKKLSNRSKTLLLLDALDEDPACYGNVENRLHDLLVETSRFRRVILSCRTQFFPETGALPRCQPGRVEIGGFTCPMFYLSLFNDQQVELYLKKRFPRRWQDLLLQRDNLLKTKATNLVGRINSLRLRPLMLSYIEDILTGEIETSDDEFSLFNALIRQWLKREQEKIYEVKRDASITADLLLNACIKIAETMQRSESRIVSKVQLETMMKNDPELSALQYIEVGGRSLLNRNSEGAYRFSHYSIQEFLLVYAASAGKLSSTLSGLHATAQMASFIAGAPQKISLETFNFDCTAIAPIIKKLAPMERIPGGSFLMGDSQNKQHRVTVNDFLIGAYPVTQNLYRLVTNETPSHFSGDNRPVESISWFDAVRFCNRLSEMVGLQPVYDIDGEHVTWRDNVDGYRLPTEAEWEYACRAGTTGDRYGKLDEIAWYDKNSHSATHEVGLKEPNSFGLYDMLGNVWEWVWDWYAEYPEQPLANPKGPEEGSGRVVRGGSWDLGAVHCRSAYRDYDRPDHRYHFLGFRLVRSLS